MINDTRFQLLQDWVKNTLKWDDARIEVASADASFRRYFRIHYQSKSFIAMDAPPEKEDTQPFIDITKRLLAVEVHAPEIIAEHTEQGFLILEDLGTVPYQDVLTDTTAENLYKEALQALITLQRADITGLPNYDSALLHQEMELMPEWFLKTHLNIELNDSQKDIIKRSFKHLTEAITQQATGFVHRDYHSRNLMKVGVNNPGIIDYQDAVNGPLTYDVISLLRDCYIVWPKEKVNQWALQYKAMAVENDLMPECDDSAFLRDFDLMGLQRHIKVLGIFARLHHRDGKAHYLEDLPLTLSYVLEIGKDHPETAPLVELFNELEIAKHLGIVEIPQ
ncbi:MAG: phosphotransferase [Thiotrichaceae bacterium]